MARGSRQQRPAASDIATTFLRWTAIRAVCHRGHVLVSSLYFVIDAHLSASQLLLLGSVVAATMVLADVPTGIWADTVSRKWPIVIGHLFLAVGMMMLGLVTAFPDLELTLDELIGEGDTVVVRWTMRGTHLGEMRGGIAPTGKPFTVTGTTTNRVAGGKITEAWGNIDLLGLMLQLGLVTPPGPPAS
jgi:MFS family permease